MGKRFKTGVDAHELTILLTVKIWAPIYLFCGYYKNLLRNI